MIKFFLKFMILAAMILGPAPASAQQGLPPDPARARKEQAYKRQELLISHGINLDPASMLTFLRNGFPEENLPEGLPQEPRVKTAVVNAAIEELADRKSVV